MEATEIAAEIVLYGNRVNGFAFLAKPCDGSEPFGDAPVDESEGMPHETATAALWAADRALRDRDVHGTARVIAPGGGRSTEVTLGKVPSYGWLNWDGVAAP